MSGIIFYKTQSLDIIHHFYHTILEMELWLEQSNGYIFKKGNLLIGFIESEKAETESTITFFDQDKRNIDKAYEKFRSLVTQDIRVNEKYNIYHFYICDPEGRKIEFQTFLHPLKSYHTAEETFINRRSIRAFKDKPVDTETLNKIFELCRYSPTARNSQSYYYLVVTNKKDLRWLAASRGRAGDPILRAPIAVLVITDNNKTSRLAQDASIAGTYYMLSAYNYDVATCWITDMDKNNIKTYFNIPKDHYVACAIATGYPDEVKEKPIRRNIEEFVKYDKF